MELSVAEAAKRLGVDDSRARVMLRAGLLPGRRVGRQWLVPSEEVSRLSSQRRFAGRPFAPARAWGVLDLLDSGSAPWLSPVARSQTKALLRRLAGADADRWRAALRARSDVLRCRAHPAAIRKLVSYPSGGGLPAGEEEAMRRGFDLVAIGSTPQIYVASNDWPQRAGELMIQIGADVPNLTVRVPRGIWPFERQGQVSAAALAADLIESAEPRAISGGLALLTELSQQVAGPTS